MTLNRNIRVLLFGANIWYFGEGMLGPLFAVFTERVGGDILDISFAWATYLITSGFLYIIIGRLTDIYDNKERIMVAGYALNALCTFGYLLVSSPWQLFIVQSGLGVASALATPTWDALYAKHEDRKNSGFQWGLADGFAEMITGFGLIVGGLVVNYFSFTALFVTMGIIQTIATLYQARILKRR